MNRLATLATMPFLITYGVIEYSYFALCMQFDLNQKPQEEEPSSILTVDSSLMNSMSLPISVNTQIEAPVNPKAQIEAAVSALAAEQQKAIQKLRLYKNLILTLFICAILQ